MSCSTCDGYEFMPGEDGLLVRCSDCPAKVRCPVHGRIVSVGGKCCECDREARHALVMLTDLSTDLRVRAASAARDERSVAA